MIETRRGEEVLSPAELRKARRDLRRMLRRKRLSAAWIDTNADGLLAQACLEYAAQVAEDGPAARPVGWLLNKAWWRALDLLAEEGRRPVAFSVEEAHHLPDTASKTPEEQAIEHDGDDRLRAALAHLPEREQELLSLVYFGDRTVEEAGSALGWSRSSAKRHHAAALERLRAFFGDERNLQSPAVLVLVFTLLRDRAEAALTAARAARASLGELTAATMHRVTEAWRRLLPFGEPGSAVTLSGGGRALGACGLAAMTLACGVAASGIVPVLGGAASHSEAPAPATPASAKQKVAFPPAPDPAPRPSSPRPLPSEAATKASPERQQAARAGASPRPASRKPQRFGSTAPATTRNAGEFGVEGGSTTQIPSPPTPAPADDDEPESAPSPAARPAASPPQEASAGHSSSGAEFGF